MSNFKHKYLIIYMQEQLNGTKFQNEIINTNAKIEEVVNAYIEESKVLLNIIQFR